MHQNAPTFTWKILFLILSSCHAFLPPSSSPRVIDHIRSDRRTDVSAQVDKGINLLEIASKVVPQGRIVQTAKESVKFTWKRMMTELAPQGK
jgi:hypothetical protein